MLIRKNSFVELMKNNEAYFFEKKKKHKKAWKFEGKDLKIKAS
jgi:hypothetical protein